MAILIHETAEVSPEAVIGEGTQIWNQVQVREGARVGEGCTLSKNVYIDKDVSIGSRVKIQNNVNVYHGVTVKDDAFLGPSVIFTNDLFPRAFNENWRVTETIVGKGASLGAGSIIRCGITIGEYAMIGAGSVVTKDVPDYALVVGNPARKTGWVCRCGIPLQDRMECEECGSRYILRGNILERLNE